MSQATSNLTASNANGASPLGAILVFTFINSIGTGVVTNGVAFLATHGYGYGTAGNYWLSFALGATYIAGAMGIGPGLRRLAARHRSVSTRSVLVALMIVGGALCFLPWLARAGDAPPGEASGVWALWVLVMIYSPLTGALWPIVESYLSGGRKGYSLRSALGRFNVVWSAAIVVAYFGMAPLLERQTLLIMAGLGALHLISIAMLVPLRPEPGRELDGAALPHPPVYRKLLTVFRLQLPTNYLVKSTLLPYLPIVLTTLAVPIKWQTPLVAVLYGSRVLTFAVLERWHGWHGRWSASVVGGLLMLGGFAACILAPVSGDARTGLVCLTVGLAAFGTGVGTIYAGALYYALVVGNAEVEAGGKHEALIGLGYMGGPACGLAVLGAIEIGLLRKRDFEVAVVLLVAAISLLIGGYAIWKATRTGSDREGE